MSRKTERTDAEIIALLADAGVPPAAAQRAVQLLSAGHAGAAKELLATRRFEIVQVSRSCRKQLLSLDTVIASLND